MEKWFVRNPSVVSFDDHLQYYHKTISEVDGMNLIKNQECIRLDMSPLALAIKQHAKQWIECYGSTLRESAKTELLSLDLMFKVRVLCGSMQCCNDSRCW